MDGWQVEAGAEFETLTSTAPDCLSKDILASHYSECQPRLCCIFQSMMWHQNLSLQLRLAVLIPALFHALIQHTRDLAKLVSPCLFNMVPGGKPTAVIFSPIFFLVRVSLRISRKRRQSDNLGIILLHFGLANVLHVGMFVFHHNKYT